MNDTERIYWLARTSAKVLCVNTTPDSNRCTLEYWSGGRKRKKTKESKGLLEDSLRECIDAAEAREGV